MKRLLAILTALLTLCAALPGLAEVTDPLCNPVGTYPIVNGDCTLTILMVSDPDILDYKDNYLTQYLEELTGINIEFQLYSQTDATTKLDLLINSGADLPDIVLMDGLTTTQIHRYAQAGALLPLDEYFDKETGIADAYWNRCAELGYDGDTMLNQVRDVDGHLYSGVRYFVNYSDIYPYRAWINQTWLTKLNLKMPTTADEFYDVLCAFRDQDPNGNGVKDEIPMMGAVGQWKGKALDYLLDMFVYFDGDRFNNGFLPLSETDGKLDVYYDKPAYQQALIYENKLVTEGLISKTSFTDDGSQLKSLAKTGNDIGVVVRGGASAVTHTSDYVPLENMTGPDGYRATTVDVPFAEQIGLITTSCKHPEAAFLFMNLFNSNSDYYLVERYGEEGVDWDHAASGTPSLYFEKGFDANVDNHTNVWSEQNAKLWRTDCIPYLWSLQDMMEAYNGDDNDSERMNARNVMLNESYAPSWDDVVTLLSYSDEEIDEWADVRTALQTYIAEARTLFAIGDMDPVKDWDQYIDTLNQYRYKELLALDQQVYDRIYGQK